MSTRRLTIPNFRLLIPKQLLPRMNLALYTGDTAVPMGKLLPKSPNTGASDSKFGLPISKFRVQNLTRGVLKYPSPHRKYPLLGSKSEMLCKNVRIFSSDPAFSVFVGGIWKKKLKNWASEPRRWSSELGACQSEREWWGSEEGGGTSEGHRWASERGGGTSEQGGSASKEGRAFCML